MAVGSATDLEPCEPAFTRAYRIVPSRFPPVGIFDALVDSTELETLAAIEARTNNRLADELGLLDLVSPENRLVGAGTTPVMAAFTHLPVGGSRFTDGTFGVYYCADSAEVAIRESAYHRERFLRATSEPPCHVEMRLWIGCLQTPLHNGLNGYLPAEVLDPDDYAVSQHWGGVLRDAGAYGLLYPSVRHASGRCAALFRPPAISPVTQGTHYHFRFDGERINQVFEVSQTRKL
jgi:hypothetical protein